MTNDEIIKKAIEELNLRGLSPQTEKQYLSKLRVFLRHQENRPLAEMTEMDIRTFLLNLLDVKKLSSSSINQYNSALRFIFGAVMGRNLNLRMLPRRRVNKELPGIMSRHDIVKFLSCIDNLRDRAIFETIYGAGLRLSEASHLRVQDIDSDGMRLFVHLGKGGNDRYTLLSQRNLELLREYWTEYRPKHPKGYLFYSKNGKGNCISERGIQDAFHKYRKLASLPDGFTVHTLRHCFATHLLEDGTDICRIKQILGHANIQTTIRYLHVVNFDGAITSPLETLPKKRGRKPKVISNG